MKDGVALADVREELIAKAFSAAGSLNETCDIHDIHRCRDGSLGFTYVRKHLQALVRHVGGAQVRLYCTERKVGALGLAAAHAVEKRRFTYIRQPDYSAFK